jgi:hypothetical protein
MNELTMNKKELRRKIKNADFCPHRYMTYRMRITKNMAKGSDGMGTNKHICFLCEVVGEQRQQNEVRYELL